MLLINYGLANHKTGFFLQLGTGAPVCIEKFVNIRQGKRDWPSLDIRSDRLARHAVTLCEKWMLTSGVFDGTMIDVSASPTGSRHTGVAPSTERWRPHAWYRTPPVKLAIFNSSGPSVVETANIFLESEKGTPLVTNGPFAAELDNSFFSADVHMPRHIKSLPAMVPFEQVWLGFLLWSATMAIAVGAAAVRTWREDSMAAPVLAALLAMMVSGLAETLIDAPRLLTLLLGLMWLGRHENIRTAERPNMVPGAGVKP